MASNDETDSVSRMYDALMPALTKASVGDFSGEIEVLAGQSRRMGEILVGVQVLLDVINEKIAELERVKAGLEHPRPVHSLLDEVLKKSLD